MGAVRRFTALQRTMWAPFFQLIAAKHRARDLEERVRDLEDTIALRDVLSRYCYLYDSGSLDALINEVFTPECIMVNPRGTYVGRAALRVNYGYILRNKRFSFHNCHNVTVRISEPGRSAGIAAFFSDVLVLPSGGLKASYGSYVVKAVSTDGAWKIAEMRITNNIQHRLAADAASDDGVKLSPTAAAPKPTRRASSRDWIGPDFVI